ncbi:MAG: hypothetical protein HY782_24660 [Chloroflexi bacterium]|nr:hypothetical protein [Chloroflexota bacterium]
MEDQSSYDYGSTQPADIGGLLDTSLDAGQVSAHAAVPALPKPEINVNLVYVLPENMDSKSSLQFGVEAHNVGDGATGSFKVKFTLDNAETEIQDWPNMEPGTSHWQEWEHGPLRAGNHVIEAELDPDGAVMTDANRRNNKGQKAFVVAEGHFASVGRKSDAEAVVGRITTNMLFFVNNYWNNYRDALGEFTRQMQFPADAEAEFDGASGLIAGASSLLKASLDLALAPLATTPVAPALAIIGAMQAAGEAWAAAEASVMQARGKIIVRDYISGLMERIESGNQKMQSAIMDNQIELQNELDRRIESSGSDTSTGEYKGEAAEMVHALDKAAHDLKAGTPSTGQFVHQFTVRFIQSQDEGKYDHGASGRALGTLRINVTMKTDDGKNWEIDELGDTWTLLTSAPQKENLAGILKRKLSSGSVAEVWQLGPECVVRMEYGDDAATISIGNGPLDILVSNAKIDGRIAERIWKTPAVYTRVFGVHNIEA